MARSKNTSVQISETLIITTKQHERLLKYLKSRLEVGKNHRDARVERYRSIDKQIAGYLRLSKEDRKREAESSAGFSVKPHDVSLPLAMVQLDEALTFLMTALAPDDGMYKAFAAKEYQDAAKAFAAVMNEHAEMYDHYTNVAMCIFDQLKYNEGGLRTQWMAENVPFVGTVTGTQEALIEENPLDSVEGNQLLALDMYNTLYDPSVPLNRLAKEGEFVAWVDKPLPYRVDKMAGAGIIHGVGRFLSYDAETGYTISGKGGYYETRPVINSLTAAGKADSRGMDWAAILTQASGTRIAGGPELVTIVCWIKSGAFGLSPKKNTAFELWQFTIAQCEYIVSATLLTNVHQQLPVSIGRIWTDGFEYQTKSYSEMLLPFQRFSSFQLNVHTRAQRKKLYGLTVFDKRVFPDLDTEAVNGGMYGTDGTTTIKNIRDHITQFNEAPDTSSALTDIQVMSDIMQNILPTQLDRQVAGLERATQYQAAAVVQASNKRNLKIARTINAQTLNTVRHQMYWNVLSYQKAITLFDTQGKPIEVNPKEIRSSKVKFALADMLSGVDKLAILMNLKDILPSIIQSQAALQRIDIVGLLNYYTSLSGDVTDLTAFEFKHPLDALPQEQKDVAMQLLQTAMAEQNNAGGV